MKEFHIKKKGDLEKYIDEERLDKKQELDILGWWKTAQFCYPVLSQIARDVLTIPILTTVHESFRPYMAQHSNSFGVPFFNLPYLIE